MVRLKSRYISKCCRVSYGYFCLLITLFGICYILIAVYDTSSSRTYTGRSLNVGYHDKVQDQDKHPQLPANGVAQGFEIPMRYVDNFTVRVAIQKKMCSRWQGNISETNLAHFQYIEKHGLFYCGIEKAGSTFWRRLIQHLQKNVVASPYRIKPQDCMKNYKSLEHMQYNALSKVIAHSYKFVFVRNPYSRLLSGYVDKIFSPNPYYWINIGKNIASVYRNNSKSLTRKNNCGHDITFSEFINYVIDSETSGKSRDGHFMTANKICNPCMVRYDHIGKMETFARDTFQILRKSNLSEYIQVLNNFSMTSLDDAIYDITQAYFSMRSQALKCINTNVAFLRVWRKLQIRGIIHRSIPCPVCTGKIKLFNEKELLGIIKDAHNKSTLHSLKLQKKSMLIAAYKQIPLKTMNKLAEVFKNDFEVFNYDPYPEYLFNKNLRINKTVDIFDVYKQV